MFENYKKRLSNGSLEYQILIDNVWVSMAWIYNLRHAVSAIELQQLLILNYSPLISDIIISELF